MATYQAHGNEVLLVFDSGEKELRARCEEASLAAELLNKAWDLNEHRRKYTAAARMIYKAEQLPGFQWEEVAHD